MRADEQVERQIANPLAVEGLVQIPLHQHSVFREAGYKPCTVSILKPSATLQSKAEGPRYDTLACRTGSIAWWL